MILFANLIITKLKLFADALKLNGVVEIKNSSASSASINQPLENIYLSALMSAKLTLNTAINSVPPTAVSIVFYKSH